MAFRYVVQIMTSEVYCEVTRVYDYKIPVAHVMQDVLNNTIEDASYNKYIVADDDYFINNKSIVATRVHIYDEDDDEYDDAIVPWDD
jgi:hypothetical protein